MAAFKILNFFMMVELLHSRAAAPAALLPERRDNFILHWACLGALAPLDWAWKTSSMQKATPALFRLVVASFARRAISRRPRA
jgi:hypothetical protein